MPQPKTVSEETLSKTASVRLFYPESSNNPDSSDEDSPSSPETRNTATLMTNADLPRSLTERIDDLLKIPTGLSESQLADYTKKLAPHVHTLFDQIIRTHEFPALVQLFQERAQDPQSYAFRKLNSLIRCKALRPFWNDVLAKNQGYEALPDIIPLKQHDFLPLITYYYQWYNKKNPSHQKPGPKTRHPFEILAGYYYHRLAKPKIELYHLLRSAVEYSLEKKYANAHKALTSFLSKHADNNIQAIVDAIENPGWDQNFKRFIKNARETIRSLVVEFEKNIRSTLECGVSVGDFACMEELFSLNTLKLKIAAKRGIPLNSAEITSMIELATRHRGRLHFADEYVLLAKTYHQLGVYYHTLSKTRPRKPLSLLFSPIVLLSRTEAVQKRNHAYTNALVHVKIARKLSVYCMDLIYNAHHGGEIIQASQFYSDVFSLNQLYRKLLVEAKRYLSPEEIDTALMHGKQWGNYYKNPERAPSFTSPVITPSKTQLNTQNQPRPTRL